MDSAQLQQAEVLADRGRYQDAWNALERLLDDSPRNTRAWTLRAQLALRLQNKELALVAAKAALTIAPDDAVVLYVNGRVHKAFGDLPNAIDCYRRATELRPDDADMLTSLGVALRQSGRTDDAIAAYGRALAIAPEHAQANHNLANALEAIGIQDGDVYRTRGSQAVLRGIDGKYQKAIDLHRQGHAAAALDLLSDALAIAPRSAKLLRAAAIFANDIGHGDRALDLLDRVIEIEPQDAGACKIAFRIAVSLGLSDRAAAYAARILILSPDDDARIARRMLLSAVQESRESIDLARSNFAAALADLALGESPPADPYALFGNLGFFLAYHGKVDRDLQVAAAAAYTRALPELLYVAPHCAAGKQSEAVRSTKIRIGIISRFLYRHSIGKTTRGLVERLDRNRFEVIVIRILPSQDDEVSALIDAAADRVVSVDSAAGLAQAHAQIGELKLDILFYQDIGMEPMSYSLSFARLAHVQCVSYGHPNTTGVPAMDYFISNDLYELPDAAEHYSERLFLLKDLPTLAFYHRPAAPARTMSRADLGLPEDYNIYICPQVLFKLHPDFDALIAGILQRDPRGKLVLIRSAYSEWNTKLVARLARQAPQLAERIVFISAVLPERFLQLLDACDVMLDTLHFNGMNSSLEAFAVGLPVVTLPTQLQRGRHTLAMYKKMGITDCIADGPNSYIEIAVRLGTVAAYRNEIRRRILERNAALYEDPRTVSEFERFFLAAMRLENT